MAVKTRLQLPTKEEILTTWNRAFLRDKKSIPMVPAVYVLVSRGEILYIGTSKFLYKRVVRNIYDHPIRSLASNIVQDKPGQVSFESIRSYLISKYNLEIYWWNFNPPDTKKRYTLEYQLIEKFRPPLNGYAPRVGDSTL